MPDVLMNQLPPQTRDLLNALSSEDGVKKVMLRPVYGGDDEGEPATSQAEIVADMFNIMRLDTKALGQAAGVDIEVRRMSPERCAELLQGLVRGEDFGLIQRFNDLEDKRERVLLELTDEETVREHRETKLSVLYSDVAPDSDQHDDGNGGGE